MWCCVALTLGSGGCGGSRNEQPVDAVITADPAVTFAPLVMLHSDEKLLPIGAREFIAYSTLSWAIDGCSDETVATGADRLALGRDPKTAVLDPRRLGNDPAYGHRTLKGRYCRIRDTTEYLTTDRTRPYEDVSVDRPPSLQRGDGFYLDLLTSKLEGRANVTRRGSKTILADTPAYYESTVEDVDGRPGLRLTYWLLYGAHQVPGQTVSPGHEGDWERVAVLLRRGARRDRYVPVSAQYFVEGRPRTIAWQAIERATGGGPAGSSATHPIVFAALGSHTPYPDPGHHVVEVRVGGRRSTIRHRTLACAACPRWQTWRRLLDVRAQPWYGFGGSWGYVDYVTGTPGPLGPSRFAR